MGGQGQQIGGLALSLMGILGACLTCGLPMWRESHFTGANILSAQSVFDGLWWTCHQQATGHMLCKSHAASMSPDIKAGRVLTVFSIISGILGFVASLVGGGAVKRKRSPPDQKGPPSVPLNGKKVKLLGGSLSGLSGVFCLVSVGLSAATTVSNARDPCVDAAQKREVGSAIYVGGGSSLLLLLSGALSSCSCGEAGVPRPPARDKRSSARRRPNKRSSSLPSNVTLLRSDVARSNHSRMFDRRAPYWRVEAPAPVHPPLNKAQGGAPV